jgi:hypothetical protein
MSDAGSKATKSFVGAAFLAVAFWAKTLVKFAAIKAKAAIKAVNLFISNSKIHSINGV